MAQHAHKGDTVSVHYTGRLNDGTVFDSSDSRDPLEFELGSGQVIPGFEQGVEGMEVGEEKTVTVPAEKAYGPRHQELVAVVGREQFPEGFTPEVGMQLQLQLENGQPIVATITEVSDGAVTLDANHFLAGKDLVFDLKLVAVQTSSSSGGSTGS